MTNIVFYKNPDGSMTFICDEGDRKQGFTFSPSSALTLPIPSLITLRMDFSYLASVVEKERSDLKLQLKKLGIDIIQRLRMQDPKLSKTAAEDMIYTDSDYYSLSERINELELYISILLSIVKSIDLIIEYNHKTAYYDYVPPQPQTPVPPIRRYEVSPKDQFQQDIQHEPDISTENQVIQPKVQQQEPAVQNPKQQRKSIGDIIQPNTDW